MTPYGGIGSANVMNMPLDEIVSALGAGGGDWFQNAEGVVKAQAEARRAELASLAQDIHYAFSSPSGQKVLRWMIEKTLLNPALPLTFGATFDQSAPWRAGREAENAFVFQILTAMHEHRQAQGTAP